MLLKIRHCFFNADKLKVVNCMSPSAAAQHIEAPLNVLVVLVSFD